MEIAADKLIELILKFGIPVATKIVDDIFELANSNSAVGPDEWAKLKVSLNKTATDLTLDVMKTQGIDPTTPESLAILALTK